MVMHARKTQRIGDGYFEKHQAHPYQNSKYSSSKSSYERERMRERDSPNGNSYRSDSPECDSPRLYHKSSYLSSKSRDYKSRDKYSDCVRSPKEKRSRLDSDHRTNHDRNSSEKMLLNSVKLSSQNSSRDTSQRKNSSSCQDKRDDRDRVVRVGDWSEHVSSSGKKYYYNCKTEVSQWEKPREWIDSTSRSSSRHYLQHSSQPNSRTGVEKHSNLRVVSSGGGKPQQQHQHQIQQQPPPQQQQQHQIQQQQQHQIQQQQQHQIQQPPLQLLQQPPPQQQPQANRLQVPTGVPPPAAFWPPSHHDQTNPSPIVENTKHETVNNSGVVDGQATDMEICSGDSTPTSETSYSMVGSGVDVGANTPGPPPLQTSPPEQTQQQLQPHVQQQQQQQQHVPPQQQHVQQQRGEEAPPTPTHESQDCSSKLSTAAGGSLLAGSLAALRPQPPNLTPSLANHYRDDLVNHVRGWPAEIIEKQAQKLSEEAYQLGTMCARVSAELKCPRSLVRQTEIQATLQEQRVLFLRQQIKTLEELKSQNSFMADET